MRVVNGNLKKTTEISQMRDSENSTLKQENHTLKDVMDTRARDAEVVKSS